MEISVDEAATLLNNGGVIAVPTDTVYGLAASVKHLNAVDEIFSLKGREHKNPLIIQAADINSFKPFVLNPPQEFETLAKTLWPGALTLIVPANTDTVPEMIRSGFPTIGLRIPDHKDLLDLLKKTGPLAITSANISKEPPAQSLQEVQNTFSPNFPILKNTSPVNGIVSTILIFENNEWKVLRKGAIDANSFEAILKEN